MKAGNIRVLKISANDGNDFYSKDWSRQLVEVLESRVSRLHKGVKSIELISMPDEAYDSIPTSNHAAELFAL